MPYLPFLLILTLGLLLLLAVSTYLTYHAIFHPPRMTDGKAMYLLRRLHPGDLGLPYERLSFRANSPPNQINVIAWWMAHPNHHGRTAVLLHGYADAKVGAIAWAPLFYNQGYNVLTLDLRAHGESGGHTLTAGPLERLDVSSVLDQLLAERPAQMKHIVLFGASLGAAVATQVATMRTDIAAVILDSPYADFRQAAIAHANLLGFPGRMIQRLALKLAEWKTGADFAALSPPAALPNIPCPLLLIQSELDPFTTDEDIATLKSAAEARSAPTTYWLAEDTDHLMALHRYLGLYEEKVSQFLSWRVAPSSPRTAEGR